MQRLRRLIDILVPVALLALMGCTSGATGTSANDPFAPAGNPGGPQGNSPASGYSLTVIPSKASALTNEESIVTATLKDASNAPLAGQTVSFSISAGPATALTTSVRTDSNGIALAFVRTGSTDVTTNVIVQGSASVNNGSVVGYGSFQVSPGNANLISTKLSLSVPSFVAHPNEELLVTATAKDSAGNALANQTVHFSVAALPAVMLTSSAVTDSHGVATAIVRAGNPAGIANVIVQADTTVNASQVTAVIPFQIIPTGSGTTGYAMTLTPSKQVVANSEEFYVTAVLKDASGNPVADQPVNFLVAAGAAQVLTPTVNTDSTGKAISRVQSGNPAANSAFILQATAAVNGTQVSALAPVQVVTQPYLPSTLRMTLSSDKSTVGSNSDIMLSVSLLDQQSDPVPVQHQSVTFSVVGGPATVLDQNASTDSTGKAFCRVRSGSVDSSSSIILKASATVFGVAVDAYTTVKVVRQASYVINFLTSKTPTDPDGTLNSMSGVVPAGFAGYVTFKQLVPFQVLDANGAPLPNVDVAIRVVNFGRNPDTLVELVPPWPGTPVLYPAENGAVTVRTDDHGTGIFTCNVTVSSPGPGLTNTETVVYQASATVTVPGQDQAPANLNLSSYGGFFVTVTQEKQ